MFHGLGRVFDPVFSSLVKWVLSIWIKYDKNGPLKMENEAMPRFEEGARESFMDLEEKNIEHFLSLKTGGLDRGIGR